MSHRAIVLALIAAASAASADGTPTVRPERSRLWVLVELDGEPFAARATLQLPEPGRVAGDGPCNLYSGALTGTAPEFRAGPIIATRRACPELAAETAFFEALGGMQSMEVRGDILILTGPDGQFMRWKAAE